MARYWLLVLCGLLLWACPTPGLRAGTLPHAAYVDLNTATTRQLRQLPGVGELLAQRIIASRPFRSIDELACIKGMTPAEFQRLRPLVTVRAGKVS